MFLEIIVPALEALESIPPGATFRRVAGMETFRGVHPVYWSSVHHVSHCVNTPALSYKPRS